MRGFGRPSWSSRDPSTTTGGLVVGNLYELDLFQAERHTTESNYKLTIRGFQKAKTSCTPVCEDEIKTKYEACDDGNKVSGDGCSATCALETATPKWRQAVKKKASPPAATTPSANASAIAMTIRPLVRRTFLLGLMRESM
jgi:cysteine-rich repeat protein